MRLFASLLAAVRLASAAADEPKDLFLVPDLPKALPIHGAQATTTAEPLSPCGMPIHAGQMRMYECGDKGQIFAHQVSPSCPGLFQVMDQAMAGQSCAQSDALHHDGFNFTHQDLRFWGPDVGDGLCLILRHMKEEDNPLWKNQNIRSDLASATHECQSPSLPWWTWVIIGTIIGGAGIGCAANRYKNNHGHYPCTKPAGPQ